MINLRNNVNPIIVPDHRSYNHLISAWVKTKKPNLSELVDHPVERGRKIA